MKIISLILIATIILLTSFPALIKARGAAGGGGRARRGNSGSRRRGAPYKSAASAAAAYVLINNKRPAVPVPVPLPNECKAEVRDCIVTHMGISTAYGEVQPKHGGMCCSKLKHAWLCVCKLLTDNNPTFQNAGNAVLRDCSLAKPDCLPQP